MCLFSLHLFSLPALPLHLHFLSPSHPLFTSWRARALSFPTPVLKYALKCYAIIPFLLSASPSKGPANSLTFSSACWPWLSWLAPAQAVEAWQGGCRWLWCMFPFPCFLASLARNLLGNVCWLLGCFQETLKLLVGVPAHTLPSFFLFLILWISRSLPFFISWHM